MTRRGTTALKGQVMRRRDICLDDGSPGPRRARLYHARQGGRVALIAADFNWHGFDEMDEVTEQARSNFKRTAYSKASRDNKGDD